MSVKLINKFSDPFGMGWTSYHWLFPEITDRKQGWETLGKLVNILESKLSVSRIELPGPYANEKEMGDIGYKIAKNGEELNKLIPQLLKDENYTADFEISIGNEIVNVRIQLAEQGEVAGINVSVSGDTASAKNVSAMIKKIIEGEN